MLTLLTANWPLVALAVVGALLAWQNKDKIAGGASVLKGDLTTDLAGVIDAIANSALVKKLQITKDSIDRTVESGMLIHLSEYIDSLPEDAKAEGRSALEVLAKLVVVPPQAPSARKA